MALDRDILTWRGRPWPPPTWRHVVICRYCGHAGLVVMSVWHPYGGNGACVVMGCPACKSTENGGAF